MADVTIESIAIEITAAADSADKALERLSKNLETLRNVCASGLEGANKVAKGLQKIAAAVHDFDSVDGSKIQSVAAALQSLQNIGNAPDLTKFARSIQSIATAASTINSTDMSMFATNMQSFATAVQPLSALSGMGDISRAINALKGLPKVADGLSRMNMGTFAQQMRQITTAVQPFVTQMQSLSGAFTGLPAPIQQAVANLMNYNTRTREARDNTTGLGKSLKLLNFTAMYFAVRKVVNVLGQFITVSNEYVENLNLFTVTMGEAADEALKFANTVNEVMGIDVSQWIQNQGVFKQMTSGFGMVEEKANLVSKNLTQLGFDISSYFNVSVEDAMQKLQSAMAGEQEPLRRLGYALDEATLKQVALNHGIETSTTNMSQAQKAQLRYIAIMEQSTNAMGDMARTIESPANQIRILESRIQTLKRAIGDSLMPVVSAALPYVTAFVQILGEFFRDVADFLGFELPKFDYSDVVTKGNKDIANSFDEATKASKEFKGTLASIDQLNIIGTKTEKGSGTGNLFGADLDLDLPSYDFLGNLKEETSEAYKTLKDFLNKIAPVAKAIAGVLAAAFVIKKTSDFVNAVKNIASAFKTLNSTMIGKVAAGIAASVGAFVLLKNVIKDLVTGNSSFASLAVSIGATVTIAGTFLKLGNPIGALLTVVGAGIGAIVGYAEGLKELNEQLMDTIVYADNGGISIQGLTDGFSNYFSEISGHYDDILANTEAFKDNQDKLKNAATEIHNLTDKYIALDDEMTTEDAEKLKSNLEIIAKGVADSLGEGTQGIVNTLKGTFHDFATQLGVDVDDMVGKFYLLESMGNSAVASIKKNADALVGKIMSGENVAENMKSLQSEIQKFGVTDIGTKETFSFNEALQKMSSAKIDFNDPDTFKKNMEDITSQYKSAKSSIETAKTDQLYELEALRQQYSTMITETGDTVKEAYDKAMGKGAFDELFNTTRDTLSQAFDFDKTKLDMGIAAYMGAIDNQLTEAQKQFASSKSGEASWENFWRGAGDSAKSLFSLQGINMDVEDDIYEGYMGDFKKKYSSFFDQISESTKGLNLEQGKEIGKYLIEGMANGALETQEDLNRALDAAARGAIDEVKRICGVASPSKVFAEIGGYLMQGMAIGIDKNQRYVMSSLDNGVQEMKHRMSGIEFKIPTYTAEDVDKAANRAWRGTWVGAMQNTAQPQYQGADPQALTHASQIWSANGQPMDVNVNVQSYVELDGEQVGTAVSRYQQRQMVYSNGR